MVSIRSQARSPDCAIGEAGRNHQRLLRAADDDVNSPAVHVEMGCTQTGDSVDHQQSVWGLMHELRDGLDVVAHAGGTFRRLHVDDADIRRELLADFIHGEGLAIGNADDFDVAAEGFRQVAPALAKFSCGQHQHFVARRSQIRDRAFHDASSGRCQHEHIVLRADKFLHVGEHFGKERAKIGGAMVQRERRHRGLRGWQ